MLSPYVFCSILAQVAAADKQRYDTAFASNPANANLSKKNLDAVIKEWPAMKDGTPGSLRKHLDSVAQLE